MSDRSIRIATINNADNSAVIHVEAMHLNGKYVIQSRLHTRSNGFLSTDLFGGYQSTTIEDAPRFNRKRMIAISLEAMFLASTQHDYERLIAKPEYAKLGFPAWAVLKIAA